MNNEKNHFINSLSILININKEIEEEFKQDSSFNSNYINYDIDKTIIESIFSLLNFQLTIITQLTELYSQIDETEYLIHQKIKQILMFNHNNITYKNYIDNSSSLRINKDKIKKKKKQFINIHGRNLFENDMENNNNNTDFKKINRTLEKNFNSMNLDINSNNIDIYNKKCSTKYGIQETPIKNIEMDNNLNYLNKTGIFPSYKPVKTRQLIYKKTNLSGKTKKGNTNYLKSGKIVNKYTKLKTKDNILHKPNEKRKKKEEINPITKVKNIIKNIKLNLSYSTGKFNNNEKQNNRYSLVYNNNYSDDRNNSYYSNNQQSFLLSENKSDNSTVYKTTNQNKFKKLETSQILNECMKNVKKRLISNSKDKNNKKEEKLQIKTLFTSVNDYKTLKHHKIGKQLCKNIFNNNN